MSPLPARVQVWQLPAATTDLADKLEPVLTHEERARARRVRDRHARDTFVLTRAALRCLLAAELDLRPQDVPIATAPGGKPMLADGHGLAWNVSHTRDQSLIAFRYPASTERSTITPGVGIDLEPLDRSMRGAPLARICTAAELQQLGALDPATRDQVLLRLWVRKEAITKAEGRGLALPFSHIDGTDEGPVEVTEAPTSTIWVRDLDVGAGHLAALGTVGTPATVTERRWAPCT